MECIRWIIYVYYGFLFLAARVLLASNCCTDRLPSSFLSIRYYSSESSYLIFFQLYTFEIFQFLNTILLVLTEEVGFVRNLSWYNFTEWLYNWTLNNSARLSYSLNDYLLLRLHWWRFHSAFSFQILLSLNLRLNSPSLKGGALISSSYSPLGLNISHILCIHLILIYLFLSILSSFLRGILLRGL